MTVEFGSPANAVLEATSLTGLRGATSDGSTPRQQIYEAKPGAACAALPSSYPQRDPEATVLHEVVREHRSPFPLECAQDGGLPRFVEKDSTAYLECGVLAHGLSRVVCSDCNDFASQRRRARARKLGIQTPHTGAVAFVQRYASALQLTPHLHVLVPEVVWDEAGKPVQLPPPDEGAVEAVLVRAVRQLARRWPSEEVPWEEDEYRQLQQAAVQERLALEVPPRRPRGLVAVVEGFSLHAGTWVHGNDRQGLERLVRYGARVPVAESSLTRLPDGRYRYAPKGDGPAVDFTAEALVKRLVALLPPAHKHLTTFHGVYAPNARLRPVVMRGALDALPPPPQAQLQLDARGDDTPAAVPKPPRLDWATLQARTFGNDVWSCPCGGRRHVLALVTSPITAQEVLRSLGLLEPRRALSPHGPAPPQLSLPL